MWYVRDVRCRYIVVQWYTRCRSKVFILHSHDYDIWVSFPTCSCVKEKKTRVNKIEEIELYAVCLMLGWWLCSLCGVQLYNVHHPSPISITHTYILDFPHQPNAVIHFILFLFLIPFFFFCVAEWVLKCYELLDLCWFFAVGCRHTYTRCSTYALFSRALSHCMVSVNRNSQCVFYRVNTIIHSIVLASTDTRMVFCQHIVYARGDWRLDTLNKVEQMSESRVKMCW